MKIKRAMYDRTATIIVAASDATWQSKQGADLVCTGTDDGAILTEAENLLPADGGSIVLSEGQFNGRFAITKDNVILMGQGYNSVLRLPDGTDVTAQVLTIVGNGTYVTNLTVDGNKDNQAAPAVPNDYHKCDGIAIYSNYNTIYRVRVVKPQSHGIIVWSLATDRYADNAANAYAAAGDRMYNTIKGCHVIENGISGNERLSIDFASTDEVRYSIASNNIVIAGQYGRGIGFHNATYAVVDSNIIENGMIDLNGGHDICVSNNLILLDQYSERWVFQIRSGFERATISNNIASTKDGGSSYTQQFIRTDVATGCKDIVISNNVYQGLDQARNAFWLVRNGTTLENVHITNNHIILPGTNERDCMFWANDGTSTIENVVMTGNTVRGYKDLAWLGTSTNFTITNLRAEHNIGMDLDNEGTAEILSGNTSIDVTHGLNLTPTIHDIFVTLTSSLGSANNFWIDNIGANTFKINLDADPLATVGFAWNASMNKINASLSTV